MRLVWVFLLVIQSVSAQQNVNIQSDYGAAGYDVVAYFDAKAIKGQSKFSTEHKGVSYRFSSDNNLNKFKKDPLQFLPQYGGWCAYAMASKGEKVKVNPKTFEIRNSKLYLFYDAYFDNTFEDWIEEGPDELVLKADENWKKFQ
ncbi:YHS domain-containing (seleno)protein [Lutimonas halocynthiae]|uniref:YHS domain-containing (seleno)protein n=1 Tax=Lutimonas halocynthiae TaxID=1446477 RepID=UPI0025B39F0E|nr:YHS domain-containing (seleno)protein [Lutimonas halocynthiae]MDN3644088.1 YHS domain-containing (seleno)protein [Lutimonas halocynthiae]